MLEGYALTPSLPAADLERARAFYRNELGLVPVEEDEETFRIECGGSWFMVYSSQFAGTNQATAAGWQVPDVAKVVADLQSRGVVFEEYDFPGLKTVNGIATMDEGNGKAAWFKDTEGNILSVFERS